MEEEVKIVCSNPWCKSHFFAKVKEDEEWPKVCNKCQSFDRQLSGGIKWEEKKYEGDRMDGMPHSFKYKINKYY